MYKMYDCEQGGPDPLTAIHDNIVVYSAIKNLKTKLAFNNFAVKYVLSGVERYTVNGKDYDLKSGEYLLCNASSEGGIFVESAHDVKGICIDISTDLIAEVVASHRRPDTFEPDIELDKYFTTRSFMEYQNHHDHTILGNTLRDFGRIIANNPDHNYNFDKEFFYSLSENILADCLPTYRQLQSIGSIKSDTKKELLKRLSIGKTFIDLHFTNHIDIENVAVEARISQYHFFRLFKKVYGISPYQYIKQKRLTLARSYIARNNKSISEIASLVGYADVFSLSKAYKQFFGQAPTVSET
jgi:AraC family transcriptional regulator